MNSDFCDKCRTYQPTSWECGCTMPQYLDTCKTCKWNRPVANWACLCHIKPKQYRRIKITDFISDGKLDKLC